MAQNNAPSRSWVFTVNNWTEVQLDNLKELASDDKECVYTVIGKEVGESGTPHLQGCITFKSPKRRAAVSKLIPSAFVDRARSVAHARAYCTKEDDDAFVQDNRKQGARTDLQIAVDMVATQGVLMIVEQDPAMFVRYHAGFEKLEARLQKPRDPNAPPEIWWLFGPTGVGKSRFVHEREADLWVAMASHKWWEGYDQQEAILIDDMRCNYAPFNELLKILDRYPYKAERKGSYVQVNSKRIYITSQFPPHKVYNRENRSGEDINQLYRRITKIIEVKNSLTELPDSVCTTLVHGNWFVERDKSSLLSEDAAASAPGFTIPWPS